MTISPYKIKIERLDIMRRYRFIFVLSGSFLFSIPCFGSGFSETAQIHSIFSPKTIYECVNQTLDKNLLEGLLNFKAYKAIGLIMDANDGKIIALSYVTEKAPSLISRKDEIKNASEFRFRDGSVLKLLTLAVALDSHSVLPSDRFHIPKSIRVNPFILRDRKSAGRSSSVEDIFIYSSNIGTAILAKKIRWPKERTFLKTLLETSTSNGVSTLTEPLLPVEDETSTLLASIGHNVFATPFHYAAAIASVVNGGFLVHPSFLERADLSRRQRVLSDENTSIEVRKVLQKKFQSLPMRSETREHWIGGFSNTAEKRLEDGGYSQNHLVTSFVAVAPIDSPKYIFLTIFDEPIPLIQTGGPVSAGENAAPIAQKIIRETESILELR